MSAKVNPGRILFIQAPLGRPEPLVYPLGIVTLAGSLPRHLSVQIIDPNRLAPNDTEAVIRDFQPNVICLSIRNLDSQLRRDLFYYYRYLKDFIRSLRSWCRHSVIIAGGSGFSLFPERIMQDNGDLDLGIFLEADCILPALLDQLEEPARLKGVFYRSQGQIVSTGCPDLPAPEEFGRPRYDLLNPGPYQANGGVGVQTKRGCPLHCIYCTYPHLNGSDLRMLPVDRVIDELQMLDGTWGIKEITFVDGVFNVPKSRTETLLNAIREAGLKIRWRGWFTEQGFDRSFAELCRDTGCPEFSFSPDGFNDNSLKLLGKTTREKDIHRVFTIARQTPDIRVAFNFFWNPPGQTLGTWIRMILFAAKCKIVLGKKAGGIIFGNPRIEPYTPLLEMAIRDGVVEDTVDLLPETEAELKKAFYSNPATRYLDNIFLLYESLWKIKRRFSKKN